MPPNQSATTIQLPRLNIDIVELTLVGDSSLICHAWDQKKKLEISDKQGQKARLKKGARDPHQEYLNSFYHLPDGGYGFPVVGLKSAAVDACSYIDGVTKVAARGSFHIIGEMARLEGEPRMRDDMVKIGMGTADIRYRGEFLEWRTTIRVRLNSSVLSPEQCINLFNVAGFAVGIGEWRPQKDGSHGMFHVASEGE